MTSDALKKPAKLIIYAQAAHLWYAKANVNQLLKNYYKGMLNIYGQTNIKKKSMHRDVVTS